MPYFIILVKKAAIVDLINIIVAERSE